MNSQFKNALQKLNKKNAPSDKKSWIYVPYDQVTDRVGPLSIMEPTETGIILIENPWKARRRPYHKQKLALILSNLRHFALEQAGRGVTVRHEVTDGPYSDKLKELTEKLGTITMMEAAEYELRQDLAPLVQSGALIIVPNESWLTTLDDLKKIKSKDGKYRMDAFYRHLRQKTGIMMEAGKPVGGKYSFDSENRQPWKGLPPAPEPPTFAVDDITQEVAELIERHFAHHPGTLDLDHLCASQEDADKLWQWALTNCLPQFGPYEDAMSFRSSGIFHTRISQPLNILRLIPKSVVIDVLESDIEQASKEGFIRQVIGWREYIHHMHELTDGYRTCSDTILETPTDAGYKTWSGKDFKSKSEIAADKKKESAEHKNKIDGGAAPSYLDSHEPLPAAYWGTASGLNCLDTVVESVWKEAYSHHITRLMVLSNLATLLDISPRELTDWFWVAYADAYDWVVEPNVLAMGTFALGDMMTTKPYVSGAAYINKMSDFCQGCRFDPAKNCPITRLYWAFLERKGKKLEGNQRLAMPLNSLKKRSLQDKEKDQMVYKKLSQILKDGKEAHPKDFI